MDNLHAFLAENAVEIEILYVQRAAHFAGAIIPHARSARAEATVRDIELMPKTPRPALRHFRAFEIHVAAAQIIFDHLRDRAAFHESGQNFHRQAQDRSNARDIGFRARHLHHERAAGMDRLRRLGGDADAHAGGDDQRVFTVLFQFNLHVFVALDETFRARQDKREVASPLEMSFWIKLRKRRRCNEIGGEGRN